MAGARASVAIRFFVGLNAGLLCAAAVAAVGRTLEPGTAESVFFLAKWVSRLLAHWLGDSNGSGQDLLGLAVQHAILSLAVAFFCLFVLRLEEARLKRLGWFIAASNPWVVLAVVAEHPRSSGEAVMSYGWIGLCLAVTLRGAWLAWKSWYESRLEAIVAFLVALASWLFVTTFLAPFERIAACTALLGAIGLGALTTETSSTRSLPAA